MPVKDKLTLTDRVKNLEILLSEHGKIISSINHRVCDVEDRNVTVAKIIDNTTGNWWCHFYGVQFLVLSIRQNTVLVKACLDEKIESPFNVHEFPKEAVIILTAKSFPL